MNSPNLALKNKLNSLAAIKLHLVHAKLTEQVSLANKGFFYNPPPIGNVDYKSLKVKQVRNLAGLRLIYRNKIPSLLSSYSHTEKKHYLSSQGT